MIFNPLFISESGNGQMLTPKSGKLSSNKYLFSDIVKVVMDPNKEQKKLLKTNLENIINPEAKVDIDIKVKPESEDLELIENVDTEETLNFISEILPNEIAELLKSGETGEVLTEKAISYISKEPLNADLQNFLNNLVGEEVIEKNVSANSGMLLRLEDQKSVVDIELTQEATKTSSDKVMVQTVVVPEKSKLLPLFNLNNNKLSNIQSSEVNKELVTSQSKELVEKGQTKPTLTVFSVNSQNGLVPSGETQTNKEIESILSLGKIASSNINELPELKESLLEKISFVPSNKKPSGESDLKLADVNKTNNKVATEVQKTSANNTDLNVSKITILKRANESLEKLTKQYPDLKVSTSLRKINFDGKIKNQTSDLHIVEKNKANTETKTSENLKVVLTSKDNSDAKKVDNNVQKVDMPQAKSVKDLEIKGKLIVENNKVVSEDQKVKENIKDSKNRITVQEQKNISESKNEKVSIKQEKIEVESSKDVSKDQKVKENLKDSKNRITVQEPKNISESKNEKISGRQEKIVLENNKSNINLKSEPKFEVNAKTESIIAEKNEKPIETKSSFNLTEKVTINNSEKEADVKEIKVKSESTKTLINDVKENTSKIASDKTSQKVENLETKELKNDDVKVAANLNTEHLVKESTNKKISVKVKNNVKNISNESSSEVSKTKSSEKENSAQNSSGNTNDNKQNDSAKQQQVNVDNSSNTKPLNDAGVKHNFSNELNKVADNNLQQTKEVFQNSNQHVVKSISVIKEISEFISKTQKGSLSFKIDPEHLGRVKITLDTIDNVVKATIDVESDQAKAMVEKNIDKLVTQLNNNGIQLGSLSIGLANSKQNGNKTENNNGKSGKANKNKFSEDTEVEEASQQTKSLGYNTYEFIA